MSQLCIVLVHYSLKQWHQLISNNVISGPVFSMADKLL